jgi:hypothetical protein
MNRILFPLVIALLVAASHQSARGESARVEGSVNCTRLSGACFVSGMRIDGEIDASTVDKVRSLIEELKKNADRDKKQVHPYSVSLSGPGGSVTAAFALGRMLRQENIGAVLSITRSGPDVCASACVLVFAGAVHREISTVSHLAIHRPYLEVPRQAVSPNKMREFYVQMLQDVRAYLREMNVSEQLAEAMFRIEPENIRRLGEKEAAQYGLTAWDPVYKEMRDIQEARTLGLDRREFMMRRSAALNDCQPLFGGARPIDVWLGCYNGVMTKTRSAPAYIPPSGGRGGPDFSSFGTPADPLDLDWSRLPLR